MVIYIYNLDLIIKFLKIFLLNRESLAAAIIKDINKQVKEDIPIWENKKLANQPVLCDRDGPIAKFRRHYATFYANEDT